MKLSHKQIKKIAKKNNLEYLAGIPFVDAQHTLEEFSDRKNYCQIFMHVSKDRGCFVKLLENVEYALKNNSTALAGDAITHRQMGGIGIIGKEKYNDYEIRILRNYEDEVLASERGYLNFIELTVGKK